MKLFPPSIRHSKRRLLDSRLPRSRRRRRLFESLEDRRLLAVITVDTLSAEVADDGQVSVVEALQAANTDTSVDGSVAGDGADVIEFAEGLEGTITLDEALVVTSDVTVSGPGQGVLTISGNQASRIFALDDGVSSLTIENVTLTEGMSSDGEFPSGGAILFASAGTLRLTDVTVTDSTTTRDGGAILVNLGSAEIVRSTISGNNASERGGGIATTADTDLRIESSVVSDNDSAFNGGGLAVAGDTTIVATQIVNNIVTNDVDEGGGGGGIAHFFGDLRVEQSTISGNQITGNTSYGGGVSNNEGNLTIVDSLIANNASDGTLADGGGVWSNTNLDDLAAAIVNSTISGNSVSGRGGGVLNVDGQLSIRNSTITGNTATETSGGIVSYGDDNTVTEVGSSIVFGNTLNDEASDVELGVGVGGSFVSLGHNLIGAGTQTTSFDAEGDQVDVADAGLAELADNGGPTQTHALTADSPAVNAGDPAFDDSSLPNDQRGDGFLRVFDDRIDIGAFELNSTNALPTITAVDDVAVDVDTATDAITFTIADEETVVGDLVVAATSSDDTLVPETGIVLGGDDADRTLTLTPAAGLSGQATITITVTDADGGIATETFALTVGDVVNAAPTISDIENQTVTIDEATDTIAFTIADAETALDTLVVTVASSNQTLVPDANITLGGSLGDRTISVLPATGEIGTAVITVTVTDEGDLTAMDTFELLVTGPGNNPPTVSTILDQRVLVDGPAQPIDFTVGDDATALDSLTVTVTSSNQALLPDVDIVLEGDGADRTLTAPTIPGVLGQTIVTLTVVDEEGLESTSSFILEVVEQVQPMIVNQPSAVISELLLSTQAGGDDEVQFIEIRGVPGATLGENTYLAVISENNNERGEIQNLFNLSNQELGENGFLVLLQANSPHETDPESRVLRSTTDGFTGLPDGIYSGAGITGSQIDRTGSKAFFLIETESPINLGDDIDADDDGFADPDGLLASSTVLDSVSLRAGVSLAGQAYSAIVLAEEFPGFTADSILTEAGTSVVIADGHNYAARVGASFGSDPNDWITGQAVSITPVNLAQGPFEIDGSLLDFPQETAFHSRDLDHIGGPNFVGTIRGIVANVAVATEEEPSPVPVPAAGVTVFADTNRNNTIDTLTFTVDPDDVVDFASPIAPDNQLLVSAFPNVTISSTLGTDNAPFNNGVTSATESFFFPADSNRIFSSNAVDSFSGIERLRFDFYRPVRSVTIDAIGPNAGTLAAAGRVEAYRADGSLVGFEVSQLLTGTASQVIGVSSDAEDIAFVVAYADTSVDGASNRARFDRLVYQQDEVSAVTDENGQYELERLFADRYNVQILGTTDNVGQIGLAPQPTQITRYESFVRNFIIRPNSAPLIEDGLTFTVNENLAPGAVIGTVEVTDPDNQILEFEILGDVDTGIQIDAATGELTLAPGGTLDFEDEPQLELTVSVNDTITTTTAVVTININDLNESPVVSPGNLSVVEGAENGTIVGGVAASDPESDPLTYSITGGTGVGLFEIDPQSGRITVSDGAAINFTTNPLLALVIGVSDGTTGSADVQITQPIRVIDLNDPPEIVTQAISVNENSVGTIGQIVIADRDVEQGHLINVTGGTGASIFEVTPGGAVQVRSDVTLDFEQTQSYTLEIVAFDLGAPPLVDQGTITINVLDVNESPTLDQPSVSIDENSPAGTAVTTVSVSDPDGVVTGYTLQLADSEDSADFAFDAVTGALTVAEGANLDFEAKQTRSLVFSVTDPTDQDSPSQVTLLVNLNDTNDAPRVLTQQVLVSELAQPGTVVGRVEIQILDADRGDSVTVSIVGGSAAGSFEIDPETRILTVAEGASFDADNDDPAPTLEVQVTDSAGASNVGEIEVLVSGVNEPPNILVSPPAVTNLASGDFYEYVVPEGAITDPEGDEFSIAFFGESGELPSWLSYDTATRTLSGFATPDTVGSLPLTLRAFALGPLELRNDVNFTLNVETGSQPLTNRRDPLDVNANGLVTAGDALRVVNAITRNGEGFSVFDVSTFNGFTDVNASGTVTALDALLVINGIAEREANGAELEQVFFSDDDDATEEHDEALSQWLEESSLF